MTYVLKGDKIPLAIHCSCSLWCRC